jgi:hypothetical protein
VSDRAGRRAADWTARVSPQAVVLAALVVAALVRLPTLGQPLIEHQTFRQTQTAFTARIFAEDGIDLLHPQLPVLGPPFEVPLELPLFQAGAAILIDLGLPVDTGVRVAGLLTFLASAFLLWRVARRLASDRAAAVAVVAYVASPLSLIYGRASTIDYLAIAATLAWVDASTRWLEDKRWRWLVIGIAAGVVATTVKLPTFIAWPALVLAFGADRRIPLRLPALAGLSVLVAVPLAAGLGWTAYADAIKAPQPFAADLTNRALLTWNFGPLAQRLDPGAWATIGGVAALFVVGLGWLPVLANVPRSDVARSPRFTTMALLFVSTAPVLIFFNLYARHDYYQIAVAPALCLLIGLGGDALYQRMRGRAVLVFAGALAVSVIATYGFWSVAYRGAAADNYGFLAIAQELAEHTDPTELAVTIGDDWLPTTLYYAHRRGLAALSRLTSANVAGQAPLYRAASIRATNDASLELLTAWPWLAPVGEHTYRLGETEGDLPDGAVHWTRSSAEQSNRPSGKRTIPCAGEDAQMELQGGAAGTVIAVAASTSPEARVWIGQGLAPLPAEGVILVPGPSATIGCSGVSSVSVAWGAAGE